MIQIITLIASKNVSIIEEYINACIWASKSKGIDIEKILKEYENIHIQETDLVSFEKIVNENFSIFKDYNEIIDPEKEKSLNEIKIKDEIIHPNENLWNKTKVENIRLDTVKLPEETKLESFKFSKNGKEFKNNFN